jgi:hypothetical protein
MEAEVIRFKRAILSAFPAPDGAYLEIRKCGHDFGEYLTLVAVVLDDEDDDAMKWAQFLEDDMPTTWAELDAAALVGGTV